MVRESHEQIKNRIVKAAIDCILTIGLDQVQITQIAACAGISTRTLHRYYPEKDTLVSAAAAEYISGIYTSFVDAYESYDKAGMTGLDRLLLLLKLLGNHCQKEFIAATLCIDMKMYHERHGGDQASWKVTGCAKINQIALADLELGKRDGSIRMELDASRTAELIATTYFGVMRCMTHIDPAKASESGAVHTMSMLDDYMEMITLFLRK